MTDGYATPIKYSHRSQKEILILHTVQIKHLFVCHSTHPLSGLKMLLYFANFSEV